MIDQEQLLRHIAELARQAEANADMAWRAQEEHQKFLALQGDTWIYKYEYDQVLDMLHYVASEAKRLDCYISRRTPADDLWWIPLEWKKEES